MKSLLCCLFLAIAPIAKAQTFPVTLQNIGNYEGKIVTICETVTGTHQTKESKVTTLNFGKPFPNNELSVVIFEKSLANFKVNPIEEYKGKNICVTGIVKMYKNKPEIVVNSESDIVEQK